MFLSDREMHYALKTGRLILSPPTIIGPTSIDLHLDSVEYARVWDVDKLVENNKEHGLPERELRIGECNYGAMYKRYQVAPSEDKEKDVFLRGKQIVIKRGGFVLWQTKEEAGTPKDEADLICFVNGKSTRARAGLAVHLTAPTIHASWSGKITLEIANFGPLDIVLEEDDIVAQLTVAKVTSIPIKNMVDAGSVTYRQTHVGGRDEEN